jgi:hypothetical protein
VWTENTTSFVEELCFSLSDDLTECIDGRLYS